MSYILDALKKSEQDRKQGEVPGLNSFQGQPRPPRSTSRIILYILIGALFLNALVLGIWVVSRDPDPPQATADISENVANEAAEEPAVQSTGSPDSSDIVPESASSEAETIATPSEPAAEREISDLELEADQQAVDTDEAADLSLDPDTGEEEEATSTKLVKYSSLPPNIRSDMEDINISAHYYANDPQARMASINGRIMRQGQSVKNGLVLEEITRKGVVFSFRKYLFSMDVFDK